MENIGKELVEKYCKHQGYGNYSVYEDELIKAINNAVAPAADKMVCPICKGHSFVHSSKRKAWLCLDCWEENADTKKPTDGTKRFICWYAYQAMETEGRLELKEPKIIEAADVAEAMWKWHIKDGADMMAIYGSYEAYLQLGEFTGWGSWCEELVK